MFSFNRRKLIYLVVVLLFINLFLSFYFLGEGKKIIANPKNLEIVFLDIGQGDAALVRTTRGKNILIDGGQDKGIIYKLDQYIPFNRRVIDLMILTHPDPDHLNGLVEVVKRYQVNYFVYNGVNDESVDYRQFLKRIDELDIKKEIVWQGKEINFSEGVIKFIFPFKSLEGVSLKDDNDGSLVFKLVNGEKSILFAGDASQNVEEQLIEKGVNLAADILKVGHHGSKTSTSAKFLSKVKPTYAVISVGQDNKYGHPNLRVIRNLENIQTQVLRTDQLGDIIFEIDNQNIIKK